MTPRPHLAALLLATVFALPAVADSELALHGGRFVVTAAWETSTGASGVGEALPLTTETGFFWFFAPTNVELVVKLLDACAPYDRFWLFASGLTDVDVTLTVEDRWSGQREVYHHAAGTLFRPFADTSSLDVCGAASPACGQGNRADIAASPRADGEAEMLALLLGDEVAADDALYARLHDDLTRIRALEPAVAAPPFQNIWWDAQGLDVGFDAETHAAVQAGSYHEWDCLNDWYRGEATHVWSHPSGYLTFAGLLHPVRMAADYAALDGITYAEPGYLAWPAGGPPPTPGLCALIEGAAVDYFFEGSLWRHFRVAAPGSAPVLVGTWDGSAPPPSWKAGLDLCYHELERAALPYLDGPSSAALRHARH
jgi:hypothetical protein